MGRKIKVDENVWKAAKAMQWEMSDAEIGRALGVSASCVCRIHNSDTYDDYRETVNKNFQSIKKKDEPSQFVEPRHGQVTFYGDALELSRLTSIAEILGIEEFEWSLAP